MRMACCITAILLVLLLVPPGQGYPRTADQPLPVAAPPLAERQDRPAASDQDPIVCILCTDLLHLVIELFNDSWIQKATEEVEERLCPLLPTEEEIKQCKIAVHVFGHQVYDVISKWMNPRKLCQEIALCPATSSEKLHKEQSMAFSKDLSSFSGTLPAAPPHFMRQLPTLCDLCKYIVQDVQNLLTSNMTEGYVRYGVDRLCPLAPTGLQAQCSSFLQKYLPMVVAMTAEHYLQPGPVCAALTLCSDKTTAADQVGHLDDQQEPALRFLPRT